MSIEAMKQALDALEEHGTHYARHEDNYIKAITALREAIEFQEMVAKGTKPDTPDHFRDATKKVVPSHQPVAWAKFNQGEITHSEMTDGSGCDFDLKAAGFVPLYTAREWVGLTDHELQVLDFNDPERGKLARAIDAKLKERNI
jgi:hypothetical protein